MDSRTDGARNLSRACFCGREAASSRSISGRGCVFPELRVKHDAIEPLKFTSLTDQVDVVITAHGGE